MTLPSPGVFERVPEASAAPLAPPSAAPSPAPSPAVPALQAPAAPVFVGGPLREDTVTLAYPIAYDGVTYDVIHRRRPSSAEVGRFFELIGEVAETDPEAILPFPCFVDGAGGPIPAPVYTKLDDDDRETLLDGIERFLPRRLLAIRGASNFGSIPPNGEAIEPT